MKPGGRVHPRVGGDHRDAAADAGDHDRDAGPEVRPRLQPPPAVDVDRDEDRLGEEEQPLERERDAERGAPLAHELRPQQPELEAEHRAGHRADGERDRHVLRPPLRQLQGVGIVVLDAAVVGDQRHERPRDAERDEDDVEGERERHLGARPRAPGRRRAPAAHCSSRAPRGATLRRIVTMGTGHARRMSRRFRPTAEHLPPDSSIPGDADPRRSSYLRFATIPVGGAVDEQLRRRRDHHRFGLRGKRRSAPPMTSNPRHRVVVVGGGFGGLPACRFLGRQAGRRHPARPAQPPPVPAAAVPGGDGHPLRRARSRRRCAHVLRRYAEHHGRARRGDRLRPRAARRVRARRAADGPVEVPYDSLIVAAGAGQSYFGHDEFALLRAGHEDASTTRSSCGGGSSARSRWPRPRPTRPSEQAWLTIVVVGAGPDRRRDRRADPRARDAQPARRLPHLRPGDRARAARRRRHGAAGDVRRPPLGARREGAREARRRAPDGLRGSPASTRDGVDVQTSDGTETHRGAHRWSGRPACRRRRSPRCSRKRPAPRSTAPVASPTLPDLTLPGHPEVFAVGDMVTLNNLPGVAEVAMQGSLHAANTIVRRLDGKSTQALHIPRPRQRRRHRPLPRDLQRRGAPAQRTSRHGSCGCSSTSRSSTASGTASRRCCAGSGRWSAATATERIFSVAHTGGDLSAPESVRTESLSRTRSPQ